MTPAKREAAERLADALTSWPAAFSPTDLMLETAALLRELAAEPVARPPTPVGWSDTDWIKHLECSPPIGYAMRDHLYGTSKAGVLRFCPSTEIGAFAVYAAPQQRVPLTDEQIDDLWRGQSPAHLTVARAFARAIERAITGEPT